MKETWRSCVDLKDSSFYSGTITAQKVMHSADIPVFPKNYHTSQILNINIIAGICPDKFSSTVKSLPTKI